MAGHGENFTSAGVDGDRGSGIRPGLRDGTLQLSVLQVLQTQIDGQGNIPPRLGLTHNTDIPHSLAVQVFDVTPLA